MPSIEIVAVGQVQPVRHEDYPFVVAVGELKSDRYPSRFQADFDEISGVLYHLGNAGAGQHGFFFASHLLSDESKKAASFLEFAASCKEGMAALLAELLMASPVRRVVFTSDWQFGPEWTKRETKVTLEEFWELHDSRRLWLNALYPIEG